MTSVVIIHYRRTHLLVCSYFTTNYAGVSPNELSKRTNSKLIVSAQVHTHPFLSDWVIDLNSGVDSRSLGWRHTSISRTDVNCCAALQRHELKTFSRSSLFPVLIVCAPEYGMD